MNDPFRPREPLARAIYDGILHDAENREGVGSEVWIPRERQNVWRIARDYAQQHGMRVPSMADVERAESRALGHVDYAAKWAHGVSEIVRSEVVSAEKGE